MRFCSSSSSAASAPYPAAASARSCSSLRFLDNETWIGGFRVPLLRSGFRMVVFSIIIMAVVLFFRKGIMGDRELFQKKPASAAKAAKKEVRSK